MARCDIHLTHSIQYLGELYKYATEAATVLNTQVAFDYDRVDEVRLVSHSETSVSVSFYNTAGHYICGFYCDFVPSPNPAVSPAWKIRYSQNKENTRPADIIYNYYIKTREYRKLVGQLQ